MAHNAVLAQRIISQQPSREVSRSVLKREWRHRQKLGRMMREVRDGACAVDWTKPLAPKRQPPSKGADVDAGAGTGTGVAIAQVRRPRGRRTRRCRRKRGQRAGINEAGQASVVAGTGMSAATAAPECFALGMRAGACKLASGELVTVTATVLGPVRCDEFAPQGGDSGDGDAARVCGAKGLHVQLEVVDMMARIFIVDIPFLDLCEAARSRVTTDPEKDSDAVQNFSVAYILEWLTDGRAACHFSLQCERGVPRELVFEP